MELANFNFRCKVTSQEEANRMFARFEQVAEEFHTSIEGAVFEVDDSMPDLDSGEWGDDSFTDDQEIFDDEED